MCRTAAPRSGPRRLAIADSKALYSPGRRVGRRSSAACWRPWRWWIAARTIGSTSGRCSTRPSLAHLPSMPWHVDYDLRLPLAADAEELVALLPKLRARLRAGRRAAGRAAPAGPSFPSSSTTRPTSSATRPKRCRRSRWSLWPSARATAQASRCSSSATSTAGGTATAGCCRNSFPIRWSKCTRETRRKRLSLGTGGRADRSPLSRRRRSVHAHGAGFDDLEVSARAGDAGVQRFLVRPRVRTWPPRPAIRATRIAFAARFAPSNLALGIDDQYLWRAR